MQQIVESERACRSLSPLGNASVKCLDTAYHGQRRALRHRGQVSWSRLELPAIRVEPEGEQARHARHDNVGHQGRHHRRQDQRLQYRGELVQPAAEEEEDHRHDRKEREPADDSHLVAGRCWLFRLRGQCEPGLEAGEDVELLLCLCKRSLDFRSQW